MSIVEEGKKDPHASEDLATLQDSFTKFIVRFSLRTPTKQVQAQRPALNHVHVVFAGIGADKEAQGP